MNGDITRIEVGARMSECAIFNGVAYLAGQVGRPGGSVAQQTQDALDEVDRVLALAGSNKSRILSAQVWLADIGGYDAMNAVWDAWVTAGHTPARATGESRLAAPEYLVEVIVVAAVG